MSRKTRTQLSAAPVAEGVRFTIGTATAFAVRRDSKDIALRIRRERRPVRAMMARTPFVRGMLRLWQSVFGLMDGISESGELQPQRISRGNRVERKMALLFQFHPESLVGLLSGIAALICLVVAICGLPLAVQRWILPNFELSAGWINGIMCFSRILGAVLGVFLCTRLRVMNRMCMYQGAINKVLNAYEAHRGTPDIESACAASRIYRRSDAAFLVIVLIASLIAFTLIRTFTLPIQILVRILIVFVAAAIVNEPIYLVERFSASNPLRVLRAPLMWLERMFVMEPHSQMVEVALCAFNAAKENNME